MAKSLLWGCETTKFEFSREVPHRTCSGAWVVEINMVKLINGDVKSRSNQFYWFGMGYWR